MGRLVNNKGMVRMSKDGVTHDFVLESVPVWEDKGWKREDSSKENKEPSAVSKVLQEAAAEQAPGPKTKK